MEVATPQSALHAKLAAGLALVFAAVAGWCALDQGRWYEGARADDGRTVVTYRLPGSRANLIRHRVVNLNERCGARVEAVTSWRYRSLGRAERTSRAWRATVARNGEAHDEIWVPAHGEISGVTVRIVRHELVDCREGS